MGVLLNPNWRGVYRFQEGCIRPFLSAARFSYLDYFLPLPWMSDSLNSQSHCFSRGKWEDGARDGGGNWNEWELLVHLDVPSVLMRRIPLFLFICVRELWETVKIRPRPKFETLWITLLFKGGLSSPLVICLSVVSPFFSIGHICHMFTSFWPYPAFDNDFPPRISTWDNAALCEKFAPDRDGSG